jgi:hypothetical protein
VWHSEFGQEWANGASAKGPDFPGEITDCDGFRVCGIVAFWVERDLNLDDVERLEIGFVVARPRNAKANEGSGIEVDDDGVVVGGGQHHHGEVLATRDLEVSGAPVGGGRRCAEQLAETSRWLAQV